MTFLSNKGNVKIKDLALKVRGSHEKFIRQLTAINFKVGCDVFEDAVQGADL
jgi:hypothetical protein